MRFRTPGVFPMHDLFLACVFIGILLSPALVATFQHGRSDEDGEK
jgi:hypothetical protein